jgi:hypothetical protein
MNVQTRTVALTSKLTFPVESQFDSVRTACLKVSGAPSPEPLSFLPNRPDTIQKV